jgi:hypothetical protein
MQATARRLSVVSATSCARRRLIRSVRLNLAAPLPTMSSIVLDLQSACLSKDTDVDDLLRRALVIARKLKLEDFRSWVIREMNGYTDESTLPAYRRLSGEFMCKHPLRGNWMPIVWTDGMPSFLESRPVPQPIGEIQDTVRGPRDGMLTLPIPHEATALLMRDLDLFSPPIYVLSWTALAGILDAVRNALLEWTLKLEEDGILGEGMVFNQTEQNKAMGNTYNIANFTGVLGNVSGGSVQIGGFGDIAATLQRLGIPETASIELKEIMDKLPSATPQQKGSLLTRGFTWLVSHGDKIGSLSDAIRGWLENYQPT